MKIVNSSGHAEVHFLRNIDVVDGTAETITDTLNKILCEILDSSSAPMRIGIASDGAAVIVGRQLGVVARPSRDKPWLIAIHCVDH